VKAIIISGFLHNLSDNILPFLDPYTDVYIHTWTGNGNERWIRKVDRYNKFCNSINILIEEPKFKKKLHSYMYSTWRAVNLIQSIEKYTTILKFKPNLDTPNIPYRGLLHEYFHKASIQSRPLLHNTDKESCFYGSIYYQTLDERIFTGYPLAFKKAFHILFKDFYNQMIDLDGELSQRYGEDYEGSIFWMEWFENRGIKLIQDLDLKLPNNIQQ